MKKLLPILFLLFSFAAVAQNTLSSIPPVASGTDTYTVNVTGFPVSGGNAAILNRMFFARFTNANTGASTLVVNSLASAANIQKWDGSAWVTLAAGDIPAGSDLKLRWDGTRFQIQLQAGGAGGTQDLQSVMDEGSTASITNPFGVTSTGETKISSEESGSTASVTADESSGAPLVSVYTNDGTNTSYMNVNPDGFDLSSSNGGFTAIVNGSTQFTANDITFQGGGNNLSLSSSGVNFDLTSADFTVNGNPGTSGQVLTSNGNNSPPTWENPASGGGDVTGPGSSTDNAIVRFDGTTGKIIQNSTGNVITDAGLFQLGTLETVATDTSIFYGTSVTFGTNASATTKRYGYLVAQGLQTVESNRGVGGMVLQKPVGYGGLSFMNIYNSGSTRIGTKTANAKFLFMAWGENDANNEFLGVSGFDTTQFKTDYLTVVNYAITKGWSTSNIIIVAPFWFATTVTPLAIQQKYVRCARKFAADNGLKYIEQPFNTFNTIGISVLSGDGKHPSDYGMALAANDILQSMKAFINVKNNSQKLSVNDLTEVQSFKIRNLDAAADNAMVVGWNTDGSITKYSPDRWVKMYPTDPGTGFRNTSHMFTDGLARFGTVTESSTGSFTGMSWGYNNSLLTSGINRLMLGVNTGNVGYIWCYDGTNHRSIKISELGGNLLLGTSTDVSGVKLQVTGRGAFTSHLRLGSNAVGTARLHIDAETASSGTGPIKFVAPAARVSVAEAGVFGPEIGGDDLTFTITTGTVNKKLVLADGTLTSTRIPIATTNGRLTDDSGLVYNTTNNTITNTSGANNVDNFIFEGDGGEDIIKGRENGGATFVAVGNSAAAVNTFNVVGSIGTNGTSTSATSVTLDGTYHLILASAAAGNTTINLPAASGAANRHYVIKRTDSTVVNSLTIDANASENIDHATTYSLSVQDQYVGIWCDGTQWWVISSN